MSNMRLTTLNLDDECTEILRKEQNKSRYVRAAIKRYPKVVKNLDEMEDMYIHVRNCYDALVTALVDAYTSSEMTDLCEFLTDFTGDTPMVIEAAMRSGHLRVAIRHAAARHGTA